MHLAHAHNFKQDFSGTGAKKAKKNYFVTSRIPFFLILILLIKMEKIRKGSDI